MVAATQQSARGTRISGQSRSLRGVCECCQSYGRADILLRACPGANTRAHEEADRGCRDTQSACGTELSGHDCLDDDATC